MISLISSSRGERKKYEWLAEILENFRAAWCAIVKVTSLLSLNIRSEGTSLGERICREVQPQKSNLRMDLHPKTPWKRFPTLVTHLPRTSNISHVFVIQKIREPILTIPNSHLDAPFFSEECKVRFFGLSRGFPTALFI